MRTVLTAVTLASASALAMANFLAGTSGATPATGAPVEPTRSVDNSSCEAVRPVISQFPTDRTRALPDGIVTIDDWTVDTQRDGWQAAHPSNPAITAGFHSLAWLVPDTPEQLPAAIALTLDQAHRNPDPGTTARPASGWTEYAVTMRTRTVLCLYRSADATAQAQLLPVLQELVKANLDPERYYGPPNRHAHNHGLLADRELLTAAEALNDPALAQKAQERLSMQITELYDECGFTFEQSSSYQHVHTGLWNSIARRVTDEELRNTILSTVLAVRNAAHSTTYPDGQAPTIGNGRGKNVDDLDLVAIDTHMYCPDTGWFSTRVRSDTLIQQHLMRFGPATKFHGHADKGQVLWWVGSGTNGKQVLADRGLASKNKDWRLAYARGPEAHPVLLWAGGSDSASALTVETTSTGQVANFRLANKKGTWTRTVTLHSDTPVLEIADRVRGINTNKPITSNLPLDPAWSPTSNPGVYHASDGTTLTITCRTRRGQNIAVTDQADEDYQTRSIRTAHRAQCTAPRGRAGVTATLTVSAP